MLMLRMLFGDKLQLIVAILSSFDQFDALNSSMKQAVQINHLKALKQKKK